MKRLTAHILLFLLPFVLRAGDTISLRTVHIGSGIPGNFNEKLLTSGVPSGATFSDLLASQGICNVREYAPGGIAAVSLRGGNSQQTSVCWNGLPINSLFVGMMDVSLLPAGFFEGSTLHSRMDASAAGGLSGTLDLKEENPLLSQCRASLAGGNFGRKLFTADVAHAHPGFSWYARVVGVHDLNRFSYQASEGAPVLPMVHAQLWGTQALYGFATQKGFWFRAWHSLVQREIPATLQQAVSQAIQQDESHRFSAGYQFSCGAWKHGITLGSFTDHIRYEDPGIALSAPATSVQTSALWQSEHRSGLVAKVLGQYAKAYNNGFASPANLQSVAPSLAYAGYLLPRKWLLYATAGTEWRQSAEMAWNASAALHYVVQGENRLFLSAARRNRFPGLNDLYWVPGGNKDLKPEYGYEYEGGLVCMVTNERHRLEWNSSLFYREVSQQITWIPESNNWKAVNLLQTLTYGHQWKGTYTLVLRRGSFLQATFSGIYQRSHSAENPRIQLIYIPGLQYTTQLTYHHRKGMLGLRFQHMALRYVTSNGYEYIPPFSTADAWCETAEMPLGKRCFLSAGITARNITNAMFQYVYQRPTALRNFLFTVKTRIT
jgi:iron complex outermembrane receptor protein